MTPVCVNCMVYKWPCEGITLLNCSNCKYLSYCSPQCQKEHWVKVHKKQCKTLAGKVKVPASIHLPDSCPGCKEEKELGTETVSSQDCPAWGCRLGPSFVGISVIDGQFPSAQESGEMFRRFPTRTEHTVFVMQQIVSKLLRTDSLLAKKCKTEMMVLADFLASKRSDFGVMFHQVPAEIADKVDPKSLIYELEETNLQVISTISSNLGTNAGDPFLAWETLKLLSGFLGYSYTCLKDFERLDVKSDLPREVQELVAELGTSAEFDEMWDKMLEALKLGIIHHHSLLDILCGGSRRQRCALCQRLVIIELVFVLGRVGPDNDKVGTIIKPFVTFRRRIFSCPTYDCQMVNMMKETDFVNQIEMVMMSKVFQNIDNSCDYCGMLGGKVHRCSKCKTKVYCSEECLLLDWRKVHSKICNEGDVTRKVKGGKKKRKAQVKKEVDEFTVQIVNNPRRTPMMKQMFLDLYEKTK